MKYLLFTFLVFVVIQLSSCYKQDIQFGTDLGETYTNLAKVDTATVSMSTVLLDSFPTNGDSAFLVGRYTDSLLGIVSAKTFLQLTTPTDVTIANDALYDSLVCILKPNGYYYGDTTKKVTLTIKQLSDAIDYTYSSHIYNTSTVAEKPGILGSQSFYLRPNTADSLTIKLSDVAGAELFNKMLGKADEVQSSAHFVNYFKGISISYAGNTSASIIGFHSSADSLIMRLYYHTKTPYLAQQYKDFSLLKNDKNFVQILTDRSNTVLSNAPVQTDISSAKTNNIIFSQPTTGVLAKVTFPYLRNILTTNATIKLLKATLTLRAAESTFNTYQFKVPQLLYLFQTNGANAIGDYLSYSTGAYVYSTPVTDAIYNSNVSYTFDITSYINTLITTAGISDYGLYVMEEKPGQAFQMNRVAFNDATHDDLSSTLSLSVITINK